MATERIARSWLVLGKTLEGWLAAAWLARVLGPLGATVSIRGTSRDQPPPPAVGTLPGFADLLRAVSVDALDLLRFCGGTVRLGTRYVIGEREFVHAFGDFPPPVDGVPFYQHWLRLRHHDAALPSLDTHDFACRAACDDRIGQVEEPRAGFRSRPAMHLDGDRLQAYFRRCALHYKARETDEAGEADMVIDASGDIGMDDHPGAGFIPATGDPCGSTEWALAAAVEPGALTRAEVDPAGAPPGWTLSIPLQGHAWTARYAPAGPGDAPTGWLAEPWRGNVIAIGRSACRLSPLEAPQMRIAEAGLTTLRALVPLADPAPAGRAEYNRRMREVFARLDEFQGLHRRLAGFADGGDGRADCSETTGPLRHKLEQFGNNGRIVTYDGESFDAHSYALSYLGHGLMPASVNPLARQRPVDEVAAMMRRHRKAVEAAMRPLAAQRDLATHLGRATSTGR